MAIQFNCPYCTATIRVSDQYSGKQGSCPKCSTKLIVPTVTPPSAQTLADSQSATVSPSTPPTQPDVGVPPVSAAGASPIAPTSRGRRRRRKRTSKLYSIGIPVACFLTFLGIVIALMQMRPQELQGVLTGSVAKNMQIPSATVPLAGLHLTEGEVVDAEQAFEDSPEAFISSQMTCRVRLDGQLLVVDVKPGEQFQWFAVNPNTSANLRDWIRDHVSAANTQRLDRVTATGTALCKDKILKASGSRVVFDAATYRDGFGLNAHVKAFGFLVEAVTKNRKSPCAHEDSNGTLYFALPADTKSFVLRGRSLNSGKPMFPGEFTVQVSPVANAVATELPADESPPVSSDEDSVPANANEDSDIEAMN